MVSSCDCPSGLVIFKGAAPGPGNIRRGGHQDHHYRKENYLSAFMSPSFQVTATRKILSCAAGCVVA